MNFGGDFPTKKASTYVKLQDAYAAESGAVGSWTVIGYKMPASTNFTYTDIGTYTGKNVSSATKNNTVNIDALSDFKGWQADNNAKLNDCTMHSKWEISVDKPAEGSSAAAGDGLVKYSATTPAGCEDITPNFGNIGG